MALVAQSMSWAGCKRLLFLPAVVLLLLLTAPALSKPLRHNAVWEKAQANQTKYDFGLMIDAGSSGSRIHVYTWPHRTSDSLPLVQSAPIGEAPASLKVKPGISSFANNPSEAGKSLVPLLEFALQNVPQKLWGYTPIYLKATAGMRMLPQEQQEAILESCRDTIAQYNFLFLRRWAETIPGMYEGMYGWVTVNYLLGLLQKGKPMETVGALDLGGASTQITFVGEEPPPLLHGFNLTLGGITYPIYAHSYLYYGNDQARYAKNQSVVAMGGYQENSEDGCLADGYSSSFDWKDSTYTLEGNSSFDQCAYEASTLFDKSETCRLAPCSFNGVYQPPLRGKFVAFSAFYYAIDFFNLTATSTIEDIANAGQPFCALSYEELKKEYEGTDSWDYIDTYCFLNAYVCTLLEYGYGFDPSGSELIFLDDIGDVEVGWTLGAMIFQANLLPWRIDIPTVPSAAPPAPEAF